MQVAHEKDHVTHAVIGGGQAVEFGISNSAEFFNMLSSSLYKDQKLAVIREVLCNAWDAHIDAGCTHKPVEITLEMDKMIIRDFGKGIHNDDMGPIYGTYGNSTKKNDGKQTGGFGLGCKAPFAYTDHFEVQSSHAGVRTIYNLSKSSAQVMGKPGIVPIAAFPVADPKDTGLTVTINIAKGADYYRFAELIRRIASNGDMNMTLNGAKLPTINFNTDKANYMILRDHVLVENQGRIMIRYGNVIYPVDSVEGIGGEYSQIVDHLNSIRGQKYGYFIVFQAPPHSISVTPSREELSMQEHTLNTLKELFKGFLSEIDANFTDVCEQIAHNVIDNAVNEKITSVLLTPRMQLPFTGMNTINNRITSLKEMAEEFLHGPYPSDSEFRKNDIAYRLNKMVEAKMLDRGLVQTFIRELNTIADTYELSYKDHKWLQRQVIAPLLVKLAKEGVDPKTKVGMNPKSLYVYDPADRNAQSSSSYSDSLPLVLATSARPTNLFNALPYMRNIIVLSATLGNLKERIRRHPVIKEAGEGGVLFYRISMKKAVREFELEWFKNSGLVVVDLTTRQSWEAVPAPKAAIVRKTPIVGLPRLDCVMREPTHHLNVCNQLKDNIPHIENPEFVLVASTGQKEIHHSLGNWDRKESRIIVRLFGEKGAITNNIAKATKYFKKGAVTFDAYVVGKLIDFVTNNPNFQEYYAFSPDRLVSPDIDSGILSAIYSSPVLRAKFGLVNNMTEEEKLMLELWKSYWNRYRHRNNTPEMDAAWNHIKAIPLDQANDALIVKLKKNQLVRLIDTDVLTEVLNEKEPDSPEVKEAIELLAFALK
jgi:hypothetical protein